MNTKLTSVALVLIATSAAAFGADLSGAGKTRAEVRAELDQAYAQGTLNHQEFVEHAGIAPVVPRAEVRAELERAHAQGKAGANVPEYVEHTNVATGKTRAQVREELAQAYADGSLGQRSEFVEHLNVASEKSREQGREEAIRAARAARAKDMSGGS